MNFWENVVAELDFQGKTRKELALEIGFDASNIGKGEKNGNIPAADTALKIAHELGVSLESLLNMEQTNKKNTVQPQLDLSLCKKYYSTIQKLNEMPENTKNLLCKLISEWKEK
ncbi:MAG: helix-turn-helix transcriptional regulator [Treponema sp.]|nr:helix-turn-helix transcriptional regulator [Treponema sp.]